MSRSKAFIKVKFLKIRKATTDVVTFRPKFDRHPRVSTYLCNAKL